MNNVKTLYLLGILGLGFYFLNDGVNLGVYWCSFAALLLVLTNEGGDNHPPPSSL